MVKVEVEDLEGPEGSVDLRQTMDRPELEDLIRDQIERSFEVCDEALTAAGMRPTDLDSVVLVGGSTRIPLVRERVRQFFGKVARTEIDPDLVVAQGASILARTIGGRAAQQRKRIAIKQKSAGELARLRARRDAQRPALPKQPAFAPTDQVELPPPPPPAAMRKRPPKDESIIEELDLDLLEPMDDGSIASDLDALELDLPDNLGASDTLDLPTVEAPPIIHGVPTIGVAGASRDGSARGALDGSLFFDDDGLPPLPGLGEGSASLRGDPTLGFGTGTDGRAGAAPGPAMAPPASLQLGERPAPLLMDVTPHALGVELTGGYSQVLITRHAPIPAEAARVFSTARDDQEAVRIRVCQGESEAFADNQPLGEIELSGLPTGPRGTVRVQVTFQLDASGTLDVKAVEVTSGHEQSIRINLLGGADEEELAAMAERHQERVASP